MSYESTNHRTRVLIVDDSSFARFTISRQLSADPEIEIVGVARDGIDALEMVKLLKPSVVTMDVEMPRMDGLSALKRIMSECPTPVVMLSSLTDADTDTTLTALERGAVDFFLKPSLVSPAGDSWSAGKLAEKVKMAARVNISRLRIRPGGRVKHPRPKQPSPGKPLPGGEHRPPAPIVIIGCSTGGPKALCQLIPNLPGDLPASILIVQHMPPGFTRSLAQRLDQLSQIEVKEARPGDQIKVGQALLAPGNYHMIVDSKGNVELNRKPHQCGLRPAVDVTMEAASEAYSSLCIGVILTGMGFDGTRGAASIKEAGGKIIVEDESTCVIYGMPKSVVDSGNADKIVPLPHISREIVRMCQESQRVLDRV